MKQNPTTTFLRHQSPRRAKQPKKTLFFTEAHRKHKKDVFFGGGPPHQTTTTPELGSQTTLNDVFFGGVPLIKNAPQAISAKMEPLSTRHIINLSRAGKTFIADILQPRPDFDELANAQSWFTEAKKKMEEAMSRKNCQVAWSQLVVDQAGALVLLHFKHDVIVSQAKTAAGAILKCLPEEHHATAKHGLRPLDEVDRDRITTWETLDSLRPASGVKRKRDDDNDDDEVEFRFVPKGTPSKAPIPEAPKSLQELMAAHWANPPDDDLPIPPPRLMLTNSPAPSVPTTVNPLDPTSVWEFRAKAQVALVMVEVGERPELTYIHCHREPRRQILLQSRVKAEWAKPSMVHVVRVAVELANEGSIPGVGAHGRTKDFLNRCSEALQTIDPNEESVFTKLPPLEQHAIRQALGDTKPAWEGCFNCLEDKPEWVVTDLALPGQVPIPHSRCAKCKHPRAFGRSIEGLGDILAPSLERDRGLQVGNAIGSSLSLWPPSECFPALRR